MSSIDTLQAPKTTVEKPESIEQSEQHAAMRVHSTCQSMRSRIGCALLLAASAIIAQCALVQPAEAANPVENIMQNHVDLAEVNHFYDEQGKLVFDQIIYYDWSPQHNRYDVRAWRLLKKPSQRPIRNWKGNYFKAIWHDGEILRKVTASSFRETWTQYDPEVVEREYLPKERRPELRKPLARKRSVTSWHLAP